MPKDAPHNIYLIGVVLILIVSAALFVMVSFFDVGEILASISAPGTEGLPQVEQRGRIAYLSDFTEIYIMDSHGENRELLYAFPGVSIDRLDWSPDGKYISFSGRMEDTSDIFRIDSRGEQLQRLTTHPANDAEPAWSRDGSRIAFVSSRDVDYALYVVDRQGSSVTKVGSYSFDPEWSPGDQWILTARLDPWRGFYLVKADGSQERFLRTWDSPARLPAYSPDGRHVAFLQAFALKVMTADGSTAWKVAEQVSLVKPSWSPDGTRIAYLTFNHNVAVVNVNTLEVTYLTGSPDEAGSITSLSWEPAGAGTR